MISFLVLSFLSFTLRGMRNIVSKKYKKLLPCPFPWEKLRALTGRSSCWRPRARFERTRARNHFVFQTSPRIFLHKNGSKNSVGSNNIFFFLCLFSPRKILGVWFDMLAYSVVFYFLIKGKSWAKVEFLRKLSHLWFAVFCEWGVVVFW